jgi:hypothetical protein
VDANDKVSNCEHVRTRGNHNNDNRKDKHDHGGHGPG